MALHCRRHNAPWLLLCVFALEVTVRAELPAFRHFASSPADSLASRAAAGSGFSLALSGVPADEVARRWHERKDVSSPEERTFEDSRSGLLIRRRYRWLPASRFLIVETTLTNRGVKPLGVQDVAIANWTFRSRVRPEDAPYTDLAYRDDTWYGSTYWTGPDWTRVGKDWHHPGVATPSVRCFTAPRGGRVRITGRAFKADINNGGGDGVRLSVRHGTATVWDGEIDGADTTGLEPDIELDVQRGDRLRFVVHKRGQIYYDTTRWDPIVTYSNGERFQASAGFSTKRQGEHGWSYAMETKTASRQVLPRLQGLTRDLATLRAACNPASQEAITLDSSDALPLFVIADGTNDADGLLLLLDEEGPWRLDMALAKHGDWKLQLRLGSGGEKSLRIRPGQTLQLPSLTLAVCEGGNLAGLARLERLLREPQWKREFEAVRESLAGAARRAAPLDPDLRPSTIHSEETEFPPLDLRALVEAEWHREDGLEGIERCYRETVSLPEPEERARLRRLCDEAIAKHIERTQKLIDDLQLEGAPRLPSFLVDERKQLERLAGTALHGSLNATWTLYRRVRRLARHVALANPLARFGRLLFAKRVPTSYSHQVMQYYGWRARPGGGLCVLERPGYSLECRDILGGRLAGGNVLEPRLSFDGRHVVFAWVDCAEKRPAPDKVDNETDEHFYHIWEVGVDGSGLRQLTQGPFDDVLPTYLPDGGIAFCSTRRRGYSRCFGPQFSRRWDTYTLHRMDRDGDNLRTLSFHDTNEWFPTVSEQGLILFSRWDYIDRDAVTHQNLWAARPDGTNPIALWGNATASPHCTFQPQAIPGTGKIVFTASAHHSITAGSIVIVDPAAGDNGEHALTRITPEVPFPEAESRDIREYYAAPWPLSDQYFLVAYSPEPLVWEPGANPRHALGIYLLDVFGTREILYRDAEIGSTNPCPLRPRRRPPVVASSLKSDKESEGEMLLTDVYEGLGEVPRGTIKQIRVVQIFPKSTPVVNQPPVGLAGEENARAILGTVPVEPDGSARFLLPARTPVLFQALDADGFAYQTMRSLTYVQPGERVTCVGCHESRLSSPGSATRAAFRRPPSRIDPGTLGGEPFSFVRVVQPVLDAHCVKCHGGERTDGNIDLTATPHRGFTRSYWALCGDRNFTGSGTNPENAAAALVPRFGARNPIQTTPPGGVYGARGSRLLRILRESHGGVELSALELRRLAAWIDLNAIFYGSYAPEDQARQLRGEALAMPSIQ